MDFVYVLIGEDWEDMVILLSEEHAIKESVNHPRHRVEIFSKNNHAYIPTYNFYKNGKYVKSV